MIYLFLTVGAFFLFAFGSIVRDLRRPSRPTPLLCPACSNEQDFEHGRVTRCLRCGYVVLSLSGKPTGPDPTWRPGDKR